MSDLTDAERALIAAFPESKVQRIPTGVSSFPSMYWDEARERITNGMTREEALQAAKDAHYSGMRRAARLRKAKK